MWTVIVLTLTLLTFFITHLLIRFLTGPRLPPGPLGLPVFGNLLFLSPELHSYFAALAQSYGPIFRLRLGSKLAVIITSPELTKTVLKDHDITFANRDVPAAGRVATYGGHDIVWTPYGPEWRLLRKVCVREMLGARTLDAVYGIRRREIRRTIRYISGQAGSAVNVGEQMFLTAMNVVTGMMWGGGKEEQVEEDREKMGREFRRVVVDMTALLGLPNLSDVFPGLAWLDLQGVEKKMRICAEKFDRIFEKKIEQRMKMGGVGEGREDFLEILLKMRDEYEDGEGDGESKVSFTMTHLKALLMDMVVGGTDTSANTVEFAMAELLNKPHLLKKVQEELATVVGNDSVVEEHHIHKLPYLAAVMKETLRLHPVLPLLVPHCPSESCIVGGYTIPKGSRVFINVWAIHRDPSLWANPLEFNPNRFINAKYDFSGSDLSYFPFGFGRRSCAGIVMAERMVLYSLASLLHSFDWKLPEGEELDLEEKFGIVLSRRVPLTLIPHIRLSYPSLYE